LGADGFTGAGLGATFAGGWDVVGGVLVVGGDATTVGGCVTASGVLEDGDVAVGVVGGKVVGGNFTGTVAGA